MKFIWLYVIICEYYKYSVKTNSKGKGKVVLVLTEVPHHTIN